MSGGGSLLRETGMVRRSQPCTQHRDVDVRAGHPRRRGPQVLGPVGFNVAYLRKKQKSLNEGRTQVRKSGRARSERIS